MVSNASHVPPTDDEIALCLTLAPKRSRPALAALFALDARLAAIATRPGEALPVQMRLAWWREALTALDRAPAPAEPILRDLAAHVLTAGVSGAALAGMTTGWEALLIADDDRLAARAMHGEERGGRLFMLAATILQHDAPDVAAAGRGWALADIAQRTDRLGEAGALHDEARRALDEAFSRRWPAGLRSLGTLALFAYGRFEVTADRNQSWREALRFVKFRMTGRA